MMFSGTHCKRRWQEPIVHSSLIPLDEYSNIRKFEYNHVDEYNFYNFLFNVGREITGLGVIVSNLGSIGEQERWGGGIWRD